MWQPYTCRVASKGGILSLTGVKYLDCRTNLTTHIGDLPCIEYQQLCIAVSHHRYIFFLAFLVAYRFGTSKVTMVAGRMGSGRKS